MLFSLLSAALANTPFVSGSYEVREVEGSTRVDTGVHVGLDLTGYRPGIGARFDLGHRVAVEGKVIAGLPIAEGLKWTGSSRLGVQVAPFELSLGADGDLAVSLGAGLSLGASAGGETPWALGSWLSSRVEVSPDGRWTVFGGVVADDPVGARPRLEPNVGVRVRID